MENQQPNNPQIYNPEPPSPGAVIPTQPSLGSNQSTMDPPANLVSPPIANAILPTQNDAYKPVNQPSTYRKVALTFRLISLLVMMFIFLIITLIVFLISHSVKALLFFGLFDVLLIFFVIVTIKSFRPKAKNPQAQTQFTQYQTATATEYRTAEPVAQTASDEKVESWVGPVNRTDRGVVSLSLTHEIDKAAENTLLITNKQIIAIMIGPADFSSLADTNIAQNILGNVLGMAPNSAASKNMQSEALYYNKWPELVQNLISQPLQSFLPSHLNFGIPYGSIQAIEVKNGLINPGLVVHLNDGKKISYATAKKDRLAEIVPVLQAHVAVNT